MYAGHDNVVVKACLTVYLPDAPDRVPTHGVGCIVSAPEQTSDPPEHGSAVHECVAGGRTGRHSLAPAQKVCHNVRHTG